MKHKKNATKFFAILLATLTLTLSGCTPANPYASDERYQIYLKSGYEGTYEEWLASIKGEQGPKGDTGGKGDAGKSAYELYCETHPDYEGTEEEWLDDLINGRLGNKEVHTVTFDSNGAGEVEQQKIYAGGKITEPTVVLEEYILEGWYVDDTKWNFSINYVFDDLLLIAKWRSKLINVSFDTNGGIQHINDRQYIYGESYELPVLHHKYVSETSFLYFNGWMYNNKKVIDNVWSIDHDVTLVASWVAVDPNRVGLEMGGLSMDGNYFYYVVYLNDEFFGDLFEQLKMMIDYDNFPAEYWGGYKILFYYNGEQIYGFDWWDFTYSIKLEVVFQPVVYQINLDPNGGVLPNGTSNTYPVSYGKTFKLPVPVHSEGYVFLGWFSSDGLVTDEKGFSKGEFLGNGDVTLKAVYDIPVHIETVEELLEIKSRPMLSYYLEADLDISDIAWEPISEFTGSFDGNGHTITGLTIEKTIGNNSSDQDFYYGFFAKIDNANVEDVNFTNIVADVLIDSNYYSHSIKIGGLAASARNSTIANVTISGEYLLVTKGIHYGGNAFQSGGLVGESQNLTINNSSSFVNLDSNGGNSGGLVGYAKGEEISIKNSFNEGIIQAEGATAGGLVGGGGAKHLSIESSYNEGIITGQNATIGGLIGQSYAQTSSILNSNNKGNISGIYSTIGGVVGVAHGDLIINDSFNEANILSGSSSVSGGLVGYSYGLLLIHNSFNTGDVNGSVVGGLVASSEESDITQSYNEGTITGQYTTGGLVGRGVKIRVEDSYNKGIVNGSNSYAGGLVGQSIETIIKRSYNLGEITGSFRVGGIIGSSDRGNSSQKTVGSLLIENSHNSGNISGSSYVGGLVGESQNATVINSYNEGVVNAEGHYSGGLIGLSVTDINLPSTILVTIKNSFNTGEVIGNYGSAGLIGGALTNDNLFSSIIVTIDNSYNTGAVSGHEYIGGLTGRVDCNVIISNSYNNGDVSGEYYVGGIIGFLNSEEFEFSGLINLGSVLANYDSGASIGFSEFEVTFINSFYTQHVLNFEGEVIENRNDLSQYIQESIVDENFFINELGWDEEIWDFTGLDIANGIYPTLKPVS